MKDIEEFRVVCAAREAEQRRRKAEYSAKYRAAHVEEIRAYKAKYDREHRDQINAYRSAYNKRDPRARRARDARYEARHREKVRAHKAAYYLERKARGEVHA